MIGRRQLLAAAALPLPAAAKAARRPVLEEWTLLQALAPDPAELLAFLEANWLAMDRIAIAQGLFSHAHLLAGDGPDWQVAMVVGYFTPGGYDDVRAAFEAIRSRHVPVLPHGKPLAQLGRIIGNRRLRLVAAAP